MPERREVVLVDEGGRTVGVGGKRAAHEPPGHLHLAFSAFAFLPGGEMLVQRRASSKYHFQGVWANACCSHPEPGEDLVRSARRRLREELGVDCELTDVGEFVYRAVDPVSGLVEHEYDHVLVGRLDPAVEPRPDPEEVEAWRFVDPGEVAGAGEEEGYAPWFAEALAIALAGLTSLLE